jgi:hypothetical protein
VRTPTKRETHPALVLVQIIGLGLAICILPILLAVVFGLFARVEPLFPLFMMVALVASNGGADSGSPAEDIVFLEPHSEPADIVTVVPLVHQVPLETPEADCPFCGDSLGLVGTECPSCDTPHHVSCWTENRGCTVYGCSSRPRSVAA